MVALFHGPETRKEDEEWIAKSYRQGWTFSSVGIAAMAAAAVYGETRIILAIGFAGLFLLINEIASRLYDLCIRLRRTNNILSERKEP
jgi:hypothetical protein